jgi:hypothetical protein
MKPESERPGQWHAKSIISLALRSDDMMKFVQNNELKQNTALHAKLRPWMDDALNVCMKKMGLLNVFFSLFFWSPYYTAPVPIGARTHTQSLNMKSSVCLICCHSSVALVGVCTLYQRLVWQKATSCFLRSCCILPNKVLKSSIWHWWERCSLR